MRFVEAAGHDPLAPCMRCRSISCPWDRIGTTILCANCQERLCANVGKPLIVPRQKRECDICHAQGTAPYLTYPLHGTDLLGIDLCPTHFRDFLARRLHRSAYRILVRMLRDAGINPRYVFLLHELFYDEWGNALHAVTEEE